MIRHGNDLIPSAGHERLPTYCPHCGRDIGRPTGRLGRCQCGQWLKPPPLDGLWCEAISELQANVIRFGTVQ